MDNATLRVSTSLVVGKRQGRRRFAEHFPFGTLDPVLHPLTTSQDSLMHMRINTYTANFTIQFLYQLDKLGKTMSRDNDNAHISSQPYTMGSLIATSSLKLCINFQFSPQE